MRDEPPNARWPRLSRRAALAGIAASVVTAQRLETQFRVVRSVSTPDALVATLARAVVAADDPRVIIES